jgi:hypothetical protein
LSKLFFFGHPGWGRRWVVLYMVRECDERRIKHETGLFLLGSDSPCEGQSRSRAERDQGEGRGGCQRGPPTGPVVRPEWGAEPDGRVGVAQLLRRSKRSRAPIVMAMPTALHRFAALAVSRLRRSAHPALPNPSSTRSDCCKSSGGPRTRGRVHWSCSHLSRVKKYIHPESLPVGKRPTMKRQMRPH